MDTSELGGGYNPTPIEKESNTSNIKIYITIETEDDFPETWEHYDKVQYVKGNIEEYIRTSNVKVEDIEIN